MEDDNSSSYTGSYDATLEKCPCMYIRRCNEQIYDIE